MPADLLGLLAELDVSGCNPNGRRLLEDPELLGTLQRAGHTVIPWTLNHPEEWALALDAGVDGIVTDRPDRLAGWLSGRGR